MVVFDREISDGALSNFCWGGEGSSFGLVKEETRSASVGASSI